MKRFSFLKGKLQMKHQPVRGGSDADMGPSAGVGIEEMGSIGGEGAPMSAAARFTSAVAVDKASFYFNHIPLSVEIAPIGEVRTSFLAFLVVFSTFGWLYTCMWRFRLGWANRLNGSSSTRIRVQSTIHRASKKGSRSNASSKLESVGTGHKEEVYEFMDTCIAVKGQLRHVEDPDRARTLKLQLLTKDAPEILRTPSSAYSDHEDTSHSSCTNHNDLVELCLDVRKGLHRVQDPDEARKMKLQRLKDQDLWKSATDIKKQHEEAGFSRMWQPSK